MKTLLICKSIHHGSTQKIAECIKREMGAALITPEYFKTEDMDKYGIIGFGSGIYSDTFHPSIEKLINDMPLLAGKKVFLFSTAGVIYEKSHNRLREMLKAKKAEVIGDFYCKGFNTNSFLKYFGGMNRGRPNKKDCDNARSFAKEMMSKI